MLYRNQFTVASDMSFPLDMLRYDNCYPMTQEDVSELQASLDPAERNSRRAERAGAISRNEVPKGKEAPPLFKLTLVRMDTNKVSAIPTIKRWESFGWAVIDQAITRTV